MTVEDAGSGVSSTEYWFDGQTVDQLQFAPASLRVGNHELVVIAVDHAGNRTEQSITIEVMIDIDRLPQLLQLGYDSGRITNEGILNSLLAKAKQGIEGLEALEKEVRAQKGKHIHSDFADLLLEDIDYIRNQSLRMVTSMPQTSESQLVNMSNFGLTGDSEADATLAVMAALEQCREKDQPLLVFPQGRYHFYPEYAWERQYFISNHDQEKRRRTPFPLIGFSPSDD